MPGRLARVPLGLHADPARWARGRPLAGAGPSVRGQRQGTVSSRRQQSRGFLGSLFTWLQLSHGRGEAGGPAEGLGCLQCPLGLPCAWTRSAGLPLRKWALPAPPARAARSTSPMSTAGAGEVRGPALGSASRPPITALPGPGRRLPLCPGEGGLPVPSPPGRFLQTPVPWGARASTGGPCCPGGHLPDRWRVPRTGSASPDEGCAPWAVRAQAVVGQGRLSVWPQHVLQPALCAGPSVGLRARGTAWGGRLQGAWLPARIGSRAAVPTPGGGRGPPRTARSGAAREGACLPGTAAAKATCVLSSSLAAWPRSCCVSGCGEGSVSLRSTEGDRIPVPCERGSLPWASKCV